MVGTRACCRRKILGRYDYDSSLAFLMNWLISNRKMVECQMTSLEEWMKNEDWTSVLKQ